MVTDNFTGIAKFVAKLAYIYVVCNTYIPRVYIEKYVYQFHRHNKIPPSISQAQPSPPKKAPRRPKIHEIEFSEYKSMNKNSVQEDILIHESKFNEKNFMCFAESEKKY